MEIAMTVEVAAPLERVWALIDDDRNLKLWMPDVVETAYPDGKPAGDPVGTRFTQRIREGGSINTYVGEVTAYVPRRLLGVRLGDSRHFTSDVVYRLEPLGEGTRLDYACRVQLHSRLARIMSVVAAPMTRRIVKRHMANLKRVAEQGAPAADQSAP